MKIETRIKRAFMQRYETRATIRNSVITARGFIPTRIEEWKTEKTEAGNIRLLCLGNCVFTFAK